jgi:hypothetical protein
MKGRGRLRRASRRRLGNRSRAAVLPADPFRLRIETDTPRPSLAQPNSILIEGLAHLTKGQTYLTKGQTFSRTTP